MAKPRIDHGFNGLLLKKIGGRKGLEQLNKKKPKWRASSGGLDKTLKRMEILKRHGKEKSVKHTSVLLNCCRNTVYNHRRKK